MFKNYSALENFIITEKKLEFLPKSQQKEPVSKKHNGKVAKKHKNIV